MYREVIAIMYIFYGIIKLILVAPIFLTELQDLPGFNLLKDEYEDTTTAGRFYEYVLICFAIYTLIYGIGLFHIYPQKFTDFLEYRHTENILFLIMGTLLVIFYSLVLYTNLPIKKDMKHKKNYKLLGFWGGILFLLTPFIIEILLLASPIFRGLTREEQSAWILGSMILLVVIAEICYKIYVSA
jgi:hypothetical protein